MTCLMSHMEAEIHICHKQFDTSGWVSQMLLEKW